MAFSSRPTREGRDAFVLLAQALPEEYRALWQRFLRAVAFTEDIPYAFTDLIDTPTTLVGSGSDTVKVKADETGLEFTP